MQSCLLIFKATSSVLQQVCGLDKDLGIHRICPQSLITVAALSMASIARVLRGPFAEYLDQARGGNLVKAGVDFIRSCSIQKGDYGEKTAAFAEQMWKSQKVFRNPDGSVNITLRVRNRLSGGPLYDVVRCWGEEFFDSDNMQSALVRNNGNGPSIQIGASSRTNARVDTTTSSNTIGGNDSELPSSSLLDNAPDFSAAPEWSLIDEFWGDIDLRLGGDCDMNGLGIN
jgi:hypothetical protein